MGKRNNRSNAAASEDDGNSETTEKKILNVLARYRRMGVVEVTVKQVVKKCGYRHERTKSFQEPLSRLKAQGLVENGSKAGFIRLTDAGVAETGADKNISSNALTNKDYLDDVKGDLESPKSAAILDILSDGNAYTKDHIAALLGYSGDSRARTHGVYYGIQELVSMKLGEECEERDDDGKKLYHLADRCFPEGRPDQAKLEVPVVAPRRKKTKTKNSVQADDKADKVKKDDAAATDDSADDSADKGSEEEHEEQSVGANAEEIAAVA